MLFVICDLDVAATIGFINGFMHGIGNVIGIHDDGSGHISRGTTNRLDEGTIGTQETFLVCVKDRNQRYLRQIKTLTQ